MLGCLFTACGSTVSGHPAAQVRPGSSTAHTVSDLTALLPVQAQFPAAYQAVVLPASHASQAAADLSGIPADGTVQPAGCAPPPSDPHQFAVVVGTDQDTSATITVELSHSTEPLQRLHAELQRCGTVRAQHGPLTTTIATELDPPPPVNADDSLAWTRTVSGQRGGPGLTRSMRALAAQIGDVRITATYLSFGDGAPDTKALDQVFTAAVGNVRKG